MKYHIQDLNLPEMLKLDNGETVTSPEQWKTRAEELRKLIAYEEYGTLPKVNVTCEYKTIFQNLKTFQRGFSSVRTVEVTCTAGERQHKWTFGFALPKLPQPVPVFIHPEFKDYPVDSIPVEKICRHGYGYVKFYYDEVTEDNNDFTDGIAGLFYPDGQREEHDGGKIALWAWAVQRIADYLETVPEVDRTRLIPIGHSRLGKTALWAAATDSRFCGVVANASGCCGAAISRANTGETVEAITRQFPFWFTKHFSKYAGKTESMPFDQHELMALAAPGYLYVTSGSLDLWASPDAEYLGCLAASPVWELFGKKGIKELDEIPDDIVLADGDVGYHRRFGSHSLSMLDWTRILDFFDRKFGLHEIDDAEMIQYYHERMKEGSL